MGWGVRSPTWKGHFLETSMVMIGVKYRNLHVASRTHRRDRRQVVQGGGSREVGQQKLHVDELLVPFGHGCQVAAEGGARCSSGGMWDKHAQSAGCRTKRD